MHAIAVYSLLLVDFGYLAGLEHAQECAAEDLADNR
jgi:hypothetical protein